MANTQGLISADILNDIVSAIRNKLGVENNYTPLQMADAIRSIQALPTKTKGLFEGTIHTLNDNEENNKVDFVADSRFVGWEDLEEVKLNVATSIGSYAFEDCHNLTSINCVSCTELKEGSFYNCESLSDIVLGNYSELPKNIFKGCSSILSFNIPKSCITIGNASFKNCTNLTVVTIGATESICNIQKNSFENVPSAISIHVTPDLYDQYIEDSMWQESGMADKIVPCYHFTENFSPDETYGSPTSYTTWYKEYYEHGNDYTISRPTSILPRVISGITGQWTLKDMVPSAGTRGTATGPLTIYGQWQFTPDPIEENENE